MAIVAAGQALLAVLFVLHVPWATAIWPFEGTGEMSFIFVASILFAAVASIGWCLLVGSEPALAGIALDFILITLPLAVLSMARSA